MKSSGTVSRKKHYKYVILMALGIVLFHLHPHSVSAGPFFTVNKLSMLKLVYPKEYSVKIGTKVEPIEIGAARNGVYAEQLVVIDSEPLMGLKAVASDLKGPGIIPATQIEIRYGVTDGAPRQRGQPGYYDSLVSTPPEEVVLLTKDGRLIQPLWFKVRVPADAKPGLYAGELTVTTEDNNKKVVPVKLTVYDWTMPAPSDFHGHMDVIQSPESVALAYEVELWSDEHLKLLDKTFSILGEFGNKTLYIPCVRRTHFGNEEAFVRWYRDDKGDLQPDFKYVETYLDVALKHLKKIPGVILYCWEPVESMGHAGGTGTSQRTHDRPILITFWDKKTDTYKKRKGPAWGTPECKAFWKRFNDGIVPVLKKRGLEKSMLYGLIGDARPTKQAMDDITTGIEGAHWAVHSHHYCREWQGYPIGMAIALWGIHMNIVDPQPGQMYGYGWQKKFWLMYYPREFSLDSRLVEIRYKMEMWMGAFSLFEAKHKGTSRTACGLGRIGGDFWKVLGGRSKSSLAGRYPESYWGQLNLNYCLPHILGRAEEGPVPTIRSEAFREGVQDIEVRVFLEKSIVVEETKAKLGDELVKKVRDYLDDRIRMVNRSGGPGKDQTTQKDLIKSQVADTWRESSEGLLKLAVEVSKKLEGK